LQPASTFLIIGFKDIINGDNLENKIFKGDGPVNFNVDAEFYGPGVATKLLGWDSQ
jgi:hypothetical protein